MTKLYLLLILSYYAADKLEGKRKSCSFHLFFYPNCAHVSYFCHAYAACFYILEQKWQEEREDMFSSCFESRKFTCLKCINDFCMRRSVVENDERVTGWKAGRRYFWEKMTIENKCVLKKQTTETNCWTRNFDVRSRINNNWRQT